jgi:hypothetical protein
LQEALTAYESAGIGFYHSLSVTQLGEAYLLADEVENARACAERALMLAHGRGERGYEAWAALSLGTQGVRRACEEKREWPTTFSISVKRRQAMTEHHDRTADAVPTRCGLSSVKLRLFRGLKSLGVPLHEIPSTRVTYPLDGSVAGYFHRHRDPVVPTYWLTDEMVPGRTARHRPLAETLGGLAEKSHLFQPEVHVHLAVHRRGSGDVLADLLALARASVKLAEPEERSQL